MRKKSYLLLQKIPLPVRLVPLPFHASFSSIRGCDGDGDDPILHGLPIEVERCNRLSGIASLPSPQLAFLQSLLALEFELAAQADSFKCEVSSHR